MCAVSTICPVYFGLKGGFLYAFESLAAEKCIWRKKRKLSFAKKNCCLVGAGIVLNFWPPTKAVLTNTWLSIVLLRFSIYFLRLFQYVFCDAFVVLFCVLSAISLHLFVNMCRFYLCRIETKSRALSHGNRSSVFAHLAKVFLCEKEELIKRAKKMVLAQHHEKLRQPFALLKEGDCYITLLDNFNIC